MEEKTILIVDDTVSNLNILTNLLCEYDVIESISAKDALSIVKKEKIDLILLDIMMPDIDGYEVCKILKNNSDTKDIPIIFLTAKTDEQSIELAYDIGGADFVTKPFKPKELLSRVKKELKLKDLMDELKSLAITDHLTKLHNRRYFSEISKHILDLAKRDNTNLSLIIIDIDKFKNINDTYGHQTGDKVIIRFSELLKQNQRKSDISCRYGGEEFVVLLPETDIDGAKEVAQKIREKTQNNILELDTKEKLRFTVSIGVSSIDLISEKNIEMALYRADEALYKAKTNGRNKVFLIEK